MKSKINLWIFLTIATMTVIPVVMTYYIANDTLETAIDVGVRDDFQNILENYQMDLKKLGKLDPKERAKYKEEFEKIHEIRAVYSDSGLIRDTLKQSLASYFLIGVSLTFLFALIGAALLGRKISQSYSEVFDRWTAQKLKLKYLEDISSWQMVARRLAHEIKNPLTPIELMITNLGRQLEQGKSTNEIKENFSTTYEVVQEEVANLKSMVKMFSDFGQVPRVESKPVEILSFLSDYLKAYSENWESTKVQVENKTHLNKISVQLDTALFRQVLTNLIRNAVEANSGRQLNIQIVLKISDDQLSLNLIDDGVGIPEENLNKIFDLTFSTKSKEDNMGIGLTVVKKIILEHQGEIQLVKRTNGAEFQISLPLRDHE